MAVNALFAPYNWVWQSPLIALSGGSWAPTLPLTALLSADPLEYARSTSADPAATLFTMDFGVPRRVDAVHVGWANPSNAGRFAVWVGGAPLDRDFTSLAAGVVPTGWTFARASAASYWTAAGVLASAASGEPRYDHDPLTGTALGVLLEPASDQLLSNPEALGSWSTNAATVSSNSAAAPDGNTAADRIVEAATTAGHGVSQAKTFSGSTAYIYSGHFKAQQRSWVVLRVDDGVGTKYAFFNLGSGAVGHVSSGVVGTIRQLPGGYYRVAMAFTTAGGAGVGSLAIYLATADGGDAIPSYAGNTSNGLLGWGLRLEAAGTGSYPSSYLAGNRAADALSLEGAALAAIVPADASGFTLAASFSMPNAQVANGDYWVARLDDGSTDNVVGLVQFITPQVNARVHSATSILANVNLGTGAFDGSTKTAVVAAALNDVRGALGGTLSSADTSAALPIGIERLLLGGAGPVHIRRVQAYGARLSDADIQAGSADLDALGSSMPSITGGWVDYVPTTHAPAAGFIPFGRPSDGRMPAEERDSRGVSRLFVLADAIDVQTLTFQWDDPDNADGYIELSTVFVAMSARATIQKQPTITPVEESRKRRSPGGALHARRLWTRKRIAAAMRWREQDEALATWFEAARFLGTTQPVLFSIYPGAAGIHEARYTILGVLEQPTPTEHQDHIYWGMPFAIVEL